MLIELQKGAGIQKVILPRKTKEGSGAKKSSKKVSRNRKTSIVKVCQLKKNTW